MAQQIVTNTGLTFEEIRLKASGLHFSHEMLTVQEQEILRLLEGAIAILDDLTPNGYFRGYVEETGERYTPRRTSTQEV